MPSTDVFLAQDDAYREAVLPHAVRAVAVEAAHPDSWYRFVGLDGAVVGIDRFGLCARTAGDGGARHHGSGRGGGGQTCGTEEPRMTLRVLAMTDLDLAGKRVLIREDLNVPVKQGKVTSDARIVAAVPTLRAALAKGAAVLVVSHLGRPTEGESAATEPESSLAPVAARLGQLLGRPVPLASEWIGGVDIAPGEIKLLENVRWLKGEGKDDDGLARRMAALCDVFVMDAFGTAHRAQVSTHGIARHAKVACAGRSRRSSKRSVARSKPRRTVDCRRRWIEGIDEARVLNASLKSPTRSWSAAASPIRF
jgi:hypothetical protein